MKLLGSVSIRLRVAVLRARFLDRSQTLQVVTGSFSISRPSNVDGRRKDAFPNILDFGEELLHLWP